MVPAGATRRRLGGRLPAQKRRRAGARDRRQGGPAAPLRPPFVHVGGSLLATFDGLEIVATDDHGLVV